MITILFLLMSAAPANAADLPGMPGAALVAVAPAPPAETKPAETKPAETKPAETKPAPLLPPKVPERPKGTLDTAGEVARDLAARVQYFEDGQSYYRAYTKGSHTPEENKAFVKFLEDYEAELGIAKRTYAILGVWLEKKSSIKD